MTLCSVEDVHLQDPAVRALMSRMALVENDAFFASFLAEPQHYRARTTVTTEILKQLWHLDAAETVSSRLGAFVRS